MCFHRTREGTEKEEDVRQGLQEQQGCSGTDSTTQCCRKGGETIVGRGLDLFPHGRHALLSLKRPLKW